jgi:hypothetical protein
MTAKLTTAPSGRKLHSSTCCSVLAVRSETFEYAFMSVQRPVSQMWQMYTWWSVIHNAHKAKDTGEAFLSHAYCLLNTISVALLHSGTDYEHVFRKLLESRGKLGHQVNNNWKVKGFYHVMAKMNTSLYRHVQRKSIYFQMLIYS